MKRCRRYASTPYTTVVSPPRCTRPILSTNTKPSSASTLVVGACMKNLRARGSLGPTRCPSPAPARAHACTAAGLCTDPQAVHAGSAGRRSAATTGCLGVRVPRAHNLGRQGGRRCSHLGMSSRSVRTARPKLTWNSLSLGGPGPMPPPKGVMPQVCSCSSRSSRWLAGAVRLAAPRGRGAQCRAETALNGLQAGSRGTGAVLSAGRGGATPAPASMAAASGIVALSRACCLLLYSAAFALLKQAKRFTITCRSWTKIRKVSESPGLLKGLNRQTFPKLVSAHSGVLQEQ